MRRLALAFFLLFISRFAYGQSYTISTFAGGGLPINIPGTSASLGPNAPACVAADRAGNLFFVDQNTVLRLDATTGILTLAAGNGTVGFSGDNGPATSAQLNGPNGVAVDSSGNLYIADTGNFRVRMVSNGVITTVAGGGSSIGDGPATSAAMYPWGITVVPSGALYTTDYNRIRVISNGTITTVVGTGATGFGGDGGPATSAELNSPTGVAVDSAGNIYIADYGNIRVRKVSGGVITTVAGTGIPGFSGEGIPAASAQLLSVSDVAVDSAGNLYITDYNRIREVLNGLITTVAGNGISGFSGDNSLATGAELNAPEGIAFDAADNLYIADLASNRIRKVAKNKITTVAGDGLVGDNGPATSALLDYPTDVALDSAGNLYLSDVFDTRVRKIANGVITTVAGDGANGSGGDNGPATSAQFGWLAGIAVDSAGNLYIADLATNRVREVSNGVITTVAGNGTSGFSGDNGPATSAELNGPTGVAVDSAGNLYIVDYLRIRKVSNGIITTLAGDGTSGFSGDNSPASSALLSYTSGIAVDSAGNLYFPDGNRIRKISNGIITTVAGTGAAGFNGDNIPATSAQLYGPYGVALDSAGNLYIADAANERIRKVTNGVITTVAGNGAEGFGGDGGPATSAQLDTPFGIAVDHAGNVYFADAFNNRIRVLVPTTAPCSFSVAPPSLQPDAGGGNLSVNIQTGSACPWAIQDLPLWITYAGNTFGTGSATITLSVAADTGVTRNAIISVAGTSITVTQPGIVPSISAGGIVNAASFAVAPVAPGSIASVYGNFLLAGLSTAPGQPVPSLAGLSLQFGSGLTAPLFAVSGSQVNFQVPWELTGQQEASVSATVNGQTSSAQAFSLAPFAPGIFTINAQGTGQGAILDPLYRLIDASNPATAGSTVIQIYCTGLGPVTNQPASGAYALSEPLSYTTTTPTVTIGGAPATVQYSGLAPGTAGGYQVNALVPAGSSKGTSVPVVIKVGNAISNTATIAVQ